MGARAFVAPCLNIDPPAPRLRRATPQGATLAARQSRFRGVLESSPPLFESESVA
jgi:hypothetical protein